MCAIEKVLNLSTIDKNHLKCDVVDGSVANGLGRSKLYSFVFHNQQVIRSFINLKQLFIRKTNKFVLNTITFHKEDDNHEGVIFIGETFTFTLQWIKI